MRLLLSYVCKNALYRSDNKIKRLYILHYVFDVLGGVFYVL
jgi:hypothetical protein